MEVNRVRLHFEMTGDGEHYVMLLPGALGLYLYNQCNCLSSYFLMNYISTPPTPILTHRLNLVNVGTVANPHDYFGYVTCVSHHLSGHLPFFCRHHKQADTQESFLSHLSVCHTQAGDANVHCNTLFEIFGLQLTRSQVVKKKGWSSQGFGREKNSHKCSHVRLVSHLRLLLITVLIKSSFCQYYLS